MSFSWELINFDQWFKDKIAYFTEDLHTKFTNYYESFKLFFRIIEDQVNSFSKLNQKYSENVKAIEFGTIKKIEFSFIKNQYYNNLKTLCSNIDQTDAKDNIDRIFNEDFTKIENFEEIIFRKIFESDNFKQQRALDPHEYFDFNVWNKTDGTAKGIYDSSTGESSGASYLIYAIALSTIRKTKSHQGELFIYIDESGKWDDDSKNNILILAQKLNIRVILSEISPLKKFQSQSLIQYHMKTGIPSEYAEFPKISQPIAQLERVDDTIE